MADTGHMDAASHQPTRTRGTAPVKVRLLGLIPGSVYILALFIFGQLFFSDPRAILFDFGGIPARVVEGPCLVCRPPSWRWRSRSKWPSQAWNNTTEVLFMGAIAIIQVVLFALAAAQGAKVSRSSTTPSSCLLTIINFGTDRRGLSRSNSRDADGAPSLPEHDSES